jgi:UDP-3-O-[3-hydroxymyristoyl] glucosamine N-acyltransferase
VLRFTSAGGSFRVPRSTFRVFLMPLTVAEIAKRVGGEVDGDASMTLTGFAPADSARAGELTFAENERYFARAEQSAASAILVAGSFKSDRKVLIRVPNARVAFARVLPLFFPPPTFAPGIHSSAIVDSSAQIDPTAYVGPLCVIGERVWLGPKVVLESGNHVGADCRLNEVTLYPRTQLGKRVTVHAGSVIGSDGFGYVFDQGVHRKVPQVGDVIVQDDVEIGANVTIDRGALGSTVIGKGTKIDNLVQIGHNVVIGEHCLIVAQVGIAGSTTLGNYVTLAGQVGLAGHLKIGNRVTIAAQSGVKDSIPDGEKWFGYPAQPDRQSKRQWIALQRLPELIQRLNELERRLAEDGKSGQ